MPRIAGIDIPLEKQIRISLRYIYGIGPVNAMDILKEAHIDPMKKARELNEDEVGRIVGHNHRARLMLEGELGGAAGATVLGQRFETLFGARLEDLGNYVYSRPSEQRLVALNRSGGLLYLSVMPPALRWQAPAKEAPVAMPEALAALTGGDAALQQQLQRAARLVDSPINLLIHGEIPVDKQRTMTLTRAEHPLIYWVAVLVTGTFGVLALRKVWKRLTS